jgi:hypothetical protein
MRSGIKEFQPRQPLDRQLSAATLNQILRELESLRITRVVNGTFRKLPGGTEIVVSPPGSGAASISAAHPFQIKSFIEPTEGDEEPSQYLVTIFPGTINSLLPDQIFDGSTIKQHTIPKNSLRFVVLDAQSNGKQFTSAEIQIVNSAPSPQNPEPFGLPASAQFLVGAVYNSSVYQVINTNLSLTAKQQLVTSKLTPAEPGELPYEIYYVWG